MARRSTHPWAWWCWAIGAAAAVSLTHNLALIVLVCAAVITVVMVRRSDAPWARAMGLYIAGTAFGASSTEINTSWAPGFGVALLDRLVRDYYQS